jgi:hypothetical protein
MAERQGLHSESIYHIRVGGSLDQKWAAWFEGFVMASRDGGETLLSGPVVDEAALHGVLGKIVGLGLPLVLVARSGCPCSKKSCPRRGRCGECAAYHGEKGRLPYCFRPKTRWDKHCAQVTGVG